MSRPRFLTDHDFNEHVIDGILRREATVEIFRVRNYELQNQPDPVVLEFAATRGLLLLSHDVNTMTAAAYERIAEGRAVPGVFMVRQSLPLADVISDLALIWSASEAEEWRDQVTFLPL